MLKTSIKIDTKQMQENTRWLQKKPKIASQKGLTNFTFWGVFWYILLRWGQEASGKPLDPKNQRKTFKKRISVFCFFACPAHQHTSTPSTSSTPAHQHTSTPVHQHTQHTNTSAHQHSSTPPTARSRTRKNAHTVSADGRRRVFGGAAMTRRRRLR